MVHYSPLSPQNSEIRLVTLLPGKPRDAIRCTLSTASLDSTPKFSALSYVWGDPSETKPITVDGEPFDVTVNLEAGLRALRKRWKRRVLWIDAICINQQDVEEKNVQVPQMGRLFSTAPKVLVWLGPSTPDIKLAISWFRAHIANTYNTASAYWLMLDMRAAISKRAQADRTLDLLRATKGFSEFMALPYWGRMWTYQEYRLPRSTPTCLCGKIQPFQMTSGFMSADLFSILSSLAGEGFDALQATSNWGKVSSEKSGIQIEELARKIIEILSTQFLTALTTSDFLNTPDRSKQEALSTLLFHTADRHCHDERDKIYALYGMVPAAQDMCPPNYTKPFTEVMLQLVTYMVNCEHQSRSIWILFALRDGRLSDEAQRYPSWMPDFTKTGAQDDSAANIHVSTKFKVATSLTGFNGPPVVKIEHTTLRIWARSLGTCKIVLQFANTSWEVAEQIIELLQMDMSEENFANTVGKAETLESRITRACVAHKSDTSTYSTERILATIHMMASSGVEARPDRTNRDEWYPVETALDQLRGKALLVTESGCFGISVAGARDGDIVVIAQEVGLPFVLTRDLVYPAHGDNYYRMVGTAIIDGITSGGNGELFDEEFVEKIAKRDVLEFLIH